MENRQQTIREVVGENVHRIRDEAGARQDDVAAAARGVGLSWTRSKIAALERGEKALDLAEVVLLAQVMGEVAGHPVAIADLFYGDGAVRLAREAEPLTRAAMRRFLSGDPVEILIRDIPNGVERLRTAWAKGQPQITRMVLLAGEDTLAETIRHAEVTVGEAEERVARTLGVGKMDVAWLSVGLWGRTLSEERDSRVGDDVPLASRSAKRGRVTRTLIEELRVRLAALSDASQRGLLPPTKKGQKKA